MKKIKFDLLYDGEEVEVSGEVVLPGLVVHRTPKTRKYWQLTHIGSPLAVLLYIRTKCHAIELAREFFAEIDWTQKIRALRRDNKVFNALRMAQKALKG